MTVAYPLQWPQTMGRTASRQSSRFNTSVSGAVKNVMDELRRFGNDSKKPCSGILVSSNVTLTDQRPKDPGVAVYFRWDNIDCCIAVDRYTHPEENLQAIAKVIEAERTKLRHGGLNIVRAAFRGYAALPPPKDASGNLARPWWQVLGFDTEPALEMAEARYRERAKRYHPDRGGDPAEFSVLTEAIRQARGAQR